MGMFDSVYISCPYCREINEEQSKSGECYLRAFIFENAPEDVLSGLLHRNPFTCEVCGTTYQIRADFYIRLIKIGKKR